MKDCSLPELEVSVLVHWIFADVLNPAGASATCDTVKSPKLSLCDTYHLSNVNSLSEDEENPMSDIYTFSDEGTEVSLRYDLSQPLINFYKQNWFKR